MNTILRRALGAACAAALGVCGCSSRPYPATTTVIVAGGDAGDDARAPVGDASGDGSPGDATRPADALGEDVGSPDTPPDGGAPALAVPVPRDYDGDGRADPALWDPAHARWILLSSADPAAPPRIVPWHSGPGVPVPADYDGDGRADLGTWHDNGDWAIQLNRGAQKAPAKIENWGIAGDIPTPADFDGDGATDLAVWRAAQGDLALGQFFVVLSSTGGSMGFFWGRAEHVLVTEGDFDGDARADYATWDPQHACFRFWSGVSGMPVRISMGAGSDVPVPADYDGDGRVDAAVFSPAQKTWTALPTAGGETLTWTWDAPGERLVPADYDGDGKADVASWNPTSRLWRFRASATGELVRRPVDERVP